MRHNGADLTSNQALIYKNGELEIIGKWQSVAVQNTLLTSVEGVVKMNGTTDYL